MSTSKKVITNQLEYHRLLARIEALDPRDKRGYRDLRRAIIAWKIATRRRGGHRERQCVPHRHNRGLN